MYLSQVSHRVMIFPYHPHDDDIPHASPQHLGSQYEGASDVLYSLSSKFFKCIWRLEAPTRQISQVSQKSQVFAYYRIKLQTISEIVNSFDLQMLALREVSLGVVKNLGRLVV